MDKFLIKGGKALRGTVAVSGAKNSALPLMAAALLTSDKVVVRKRTVVDFDDVTVQGELVKPEGSYLLHRNKTRFEPLIQLRENFDRELRQSADNL